MPVSPLVTNNFLDSCAFDPKYEPEDKAAQEIYRLYKSGKLRLLIAHSTKKEIEHPNTPRWVKDAASRMIYTLNVNLTPPEVELLRRIETILAGDGTVENIVEDARNIFEAQKYGPYFVTTDSRILKRARKLSSICPVAIKKPGEFLAIVQDYMRRRAGSGGSPDLLQKMMLEWGQLSRLGTTHHEMALGIGEDKPVGIAHPTKAERGQESPRKEEVLWQGSFSLGQPFC